jgi:hypothetical protein
MPVGLTPLPGGLLFTADSIEYGTEIWRIDPVRPSIYGDLDFDKDVDSVDLMLLLSNWTGPLSPGESILTYSQGDSDQDGDIDSGDLLEFLAAWTGVTAAAEPSQPQSTALDDWGSIPSFDGEGNDESKTDELLESQLSDEVFADSQWRTS